MRLPFPTRIPVQKTFVFAAVVFIIQILQHTEITFAALFFAFIMLSVVGFNMAGGLSRAPGGYIFFFATLTCIVGGLWKIVVNEPGQSNLVSGSFTMATYVVSMVTIIGALKVTHWFVKRPRGLSAMLGADKINLGHAALGCFVANYLAIYANVYLPHGSGSLVNIINQENVFLPLCILLGTIHTIRKSGGRRSVSILTFTSAMLIFVYGGLIYYSKQGMFSPMACWALAAASQRYRLRFWQVLLLAGITVASVTVLTELSQVGRAITTESTSQGDRLMLSVDLLTHPKLLRADYLEQMGVTTSSERTTGIAASYFDSPQGLMDRLNMIRIDDRLVTYTLQGHTVGKMRIIYYFLNWIPHIILPDKDAMMPPGILAPGNYYAHEVGGLLSPDDFSTGISFSPTAEAFHMDGWLGIVLVGGFSWTLVFIATEVLCGDLRLYPIGLIALVQFAHVAPESLISGLIYYVFFTDLGIIIAVVFCTYVAPVIGLLLSGPQEPRIARLQPLEVSAGPV